MEMLRTIVVAMFFAGITVGSYYFLSSSPFPWETAGNMVTAGNNPENTAGNNMTTPQLQGDSSLNAPTMPTFADAGPFAPAPESTGNADDFTLPALDELPPAPSVPAPNATTQHVPSQPEIPSEVSTETPMMATAPVLDTDLPSLNDAPQAITATPEAPIGSELPAMDGNSASVAVAPTLDTAPSLDTTLPPGPELSTDLSTDSSTNQSQDAYNLDMSPTSMDNNGNQTVTNPLRSNHSSASTNSSTNSLRTNAPTVAEVEATKNTETAAVREYLKIATEKIQNGNALEVLQSLSKYYGDPRFSAEELAELTNILVQAATLVIYSQQSFLEPAYTVQPGDTVEKIALQYQIPEEFIIRVNGLTAPFTLQPGTELKVVKGPFHAIVYLDRYEMLLTLNGLFAGRFWLGIGNDLIQKDGDFSFAQKTVSPTETYYEFLRVAGVPGCGDFLRIQPATDPNSIGTHSLSGPILMSFADIDSLGALLGPRSQLIMRCSAPKAINVPQNEVVTNTPTQNTIPTQTASTTQTTSPTQPIQATPQVSMDIPVVNPPVNPAIGNQAPTPVAPELPSEPASPYSLPGTEPTPAPELPQAPITPDNGVSEAIQLPTI